jgi:hypothetical protein
LYALVISTGLKAMSQSFAIIVQKANHDGRIVTSYPAAVLDDTGAIVLLARWTRPTLETSYTTFAQGDLLFETFYADRPYNIFALYDSGQLPLDTDLTEHVARFRRPSSQRSPERLVMDFCATLATPCMLKGYYANLTLPARYEPGAGILTWFDLALDLWVPAQGQPQILDVDEYDSLGIAENDPALHASLQAALQHLWAHALARTGPFAPPEPGLPADSPQP